MIRWMRAHEWFPVLAVAALLLVAGLGFWVWTLSRELDAKDAGIRAACEQYAAPLDLSGMAALCADAGYQQTVPEDLDR